MTKILCAIDWCGRWSGRLGASFIPLMMLIVSYEVVARYLFESPTIWAMETAQYLYLASIALGGAYLLRRGGHVNVTILYGRLGARGRALLDVATFFFFFAFVAALLYSTGTASLEALANREHSATYWAPPIYPVYLVMTVGIALILLEGVAKLMRDLATAIKGGEDGPVGGDRSW